MRTAQGAGEETGKGEGGAGGASRQGDTSGSLREGGIRGYRAHPNKVRAFAPSGKEAKTDGIDAEVLALYGEVFGEEGAKEEEWDEERRDLQDIVRRRRRWWTSGRGRRIGWRRQSRKAEASIKRAIRWNTNEIGRLDREYNSLEKSVEGAGGAVPECEGRGGTDSGNAGGRIAPKEMGRD